MPKVEEPVDDSDDTPRNVRAISKSTNQVEVRPEPKKAKRRLQNQPAAGPSRPSMAAVRVPNKKRPEVETLYQPTVADLVSYQAAEIRERTSRLTFQDLKRSGAQFDSSSSSEDEEGPPQDRSHGCCGGSKKYDVDEKFDDKTFQAKFMSTTMFIMAATLVAPLVWNAYYINNQHARIYFMDGIKLNAAFSGIFIIGLNIAIRRMQAGSGIVTIIVYVLRSIALAFALTSLTSCTELLVIEYAFEAPYVHIQDPAQDQYKLSLNIKNRAENLTTTSSPDEKETAGSITDRFVHSLPVLWITACFVIFLTWVTTAIILRLLNVNKTEPSGVWMFGVGCVFGVTSCILTFVMLLLLDFGKGPRLWDLTQVFVVGILTVIEAIWLPMRWRHLLEGKTVKLGEHDYVNIAGRFSI